MTATELKSDTSVAIRFLKAFSPTGPWVLTSIPPEGGSTSTATFYPKTEENAVRWIDARQGVDNLYFMVNKAIRSLDCKAKKTDVFEMGWLHVDVDPRAGEDIETERARGYASLKNFRPIPTIIVDSGGGFQGFWKLDVPEPVNGDIKRCEELEAYNQQLELLLGGDHCFNLDRIMRLPGSINVLNKKKREKGRKPALTRVLDYAPDATYSLKDFTAAPRVQIDDNVAGGLGGGSERVKISGNLPRIDDVSVLPVSDKTRMLIVQGCDPDEPNKWSSRSELLFHVLCEMARAGCDDDTMASVIMDPDFKISESVLDKPRPERYAARQIGRAKEESIDPWLRRLNEKHAVIADIGGKCRVISEVLDISLGRTRLSRQSFEDFRNRYRHIKIDVGMNDKGQPIQKSAGTWWLDHQKRRQYETIIFAPGKEMDDVYNLWRGFACEALPGDCALMMDHVRDNICSGREDYFAYLIGWMATAVQFPDRPGEVAIVLRGKRGTGKSMFAKLFGNLFGRHYLQVSDPKHLVGAFNSHLRDCVILFGDEAFYAGDKKHESVLKMLITEEFITFEAKGVDAEMGPNYTHLMLASNDDWVVPAGAEERRFFALDVAEAQMQNKKYFGAIKQQWESGGKEAMLHFLMTMDIRSFDVRSPPSTKALQAQKEFSFSHEQQWLFERLNDGITLELHDDWSTKLMVDEVYNDFCEFAKRMGVMRKISKTGLGKFLSKVFGPIYPSKFQDYAEIWRANELGNMVKVKCRPYFYRLPGLQEAREMFDASCGGPFEWQKINRPVPRSEEPAEQIEHPF